MAQQVLAVIQTKERVNETRMPANRGESPKLHELLAHYGDQVEIRPRTFLVQHAMNAVAPDFRCAWS